MTETQDYTAHRVTLTPTHLSRRKRREIEKLSVCNSNKKREPMHLSTSFFDIEVSSSIFNAHRIPRAIAVITAVYIALSIVLYFDRHSLYKVLLTQERDDPEIEYEYIVNPFLQLVPYKMFTYPTSFVLANFVDTKPWKLVLNIVNLLLGGTFIERNWGSSREMFKFVLIVGVASNIFVGLTTFSLSFIIPPINRYVAVDANFVYIIGFSIVYKQLLPETTIIDIKRPSFMTKNFRFKLLPIFLMTVFTMCEIVFLHSFSQLCSIWTTFFFSWTYLRFFQRLPDFNSSSTSSDDGLSAIVGDASDTFQLIYLFPDVTKPYLRPIFDKTYDLFANRWKLVRSFALNDIDKGNAIAEQRGAKPVRNETEERRRELALQVLQERLV